MVRAGVAEDLPPGRHALPEFLRKCRERRLVHSECPQSVPGEGHGYPSCFKIDPATDRLGRRHLLFYGLKPSAPQSGFLKRNKLISSGQRRYAREQNVLNVVEFKHLELLVIDQTDRDGRR